MFLVSSFWLKRSEPAQKFRQQLQYAWLQNSSYTITVWLQNNLEIPGGLLLGFPLSRLLLIVVIDKLFPDQLPAIIVCFY